MKTKVDFKEVANVVRFDMLGSLKMVTPEEFEKMSGADELEFYREVFDLHHDVCRYLQANLELDELSEKFGEG